MGMRGTIHSQVMDGHKTYPLRFQYYRFGTQISEIPCCKPSLILSPPNRMLINARDAHTWRCTPFVVLGNLNTAVDWACRTKPLCMSVGGRDQIVREFIEE